MKKMTDGERIAAAIYQDCTIADALHRDRCAENIDRLIRMRLLAGTSELDDATVERLIDALFIDHEKKTLAERMRYVIAAYEEWRAGR